MLNRKQFILSGVLGTAVVALGIKNKPAKASGAFINPLEYNVVASEYNQNHEFSSNSIRFLERCEKEDFFQVAKKALTLNMMKTVSNLGSEHRIVDYNFIYKPLGSCGTIDPLEQRSSFGWRALVQDKHGVKKEYGNYVNVPLFFKP